MNKLLFSSIILVLFLFSACSSKHSFVTVDNQKIFVENAITSEEKRIGLMNRTFLCHDCGMLFIYNDYKIRKFWMKNTLIPLDIIFINENYRVIDIHHVVSCKTINESDCPIYISSSKAKYVLETNYNRFNDSILNDIIQIQIS